MTPLSIGVIRCASALGLISCAEPAAAHDVSSEDMNFETNWQRASALVAKALRSNPPPQEHQSSASALRLEIFEQVISSTANTTRAAYVSDDFEFIIGAAQLGIHDPWINSLWVTYFRGRCPYIRDE